jgi:DNA invertase Pin-like site-specific DNA recombinase
MQAAIYTRISRDREGAGLGVGTQHKQCQELAAQLGWTVVGTFSDNDITAYSAKHRPGYEALCEALESGGVHGVLVWHTDRLHRRPIELESFIELCSGKGIEVRTVRAGHLDLSTGSGQMVARMLGAAARHEVDRLVERTKSAKKQAALDGKYRGGRRCFGYEPDGMTMRTEEADAIRTAVEAVLAGVSLSQISRDWNSAGLRTSFGGNEFNSREVRKILLRERNAGIVLHEGKRLDASGSWEKIVDPETFAALEALLRDPSRRTSTGTERKYQGTGIYRCSNCGAAMIGAVHNKHAGQWRRTYVCSATKHLGRDVAHLDDYIDRLVIGRLSAPDAAIVLGGPAGEDIAALHAHREGLRARKEDLAAMFATGDVDGPQLKRGSLELQTRLDAIEARLASARASSALASLVLSGDDLEATWRATSADVRGKVIDAMMSVTVLPSRRGRQPGGVYFDPASVRIEWKA